MKLTKQSMKLFCLKAVPFFLTAVLLVSLLADRVAAEASAESPEESLPEYRITLSDQGCSSDGAGVMIDGSTVTVTEAGQYTVTGSLSDGQIRIDTDKESEVTLVLSGVSVTSSDSAAIYVVSADKVVLSLADGTDNLLQTTGAFRQDDADNVDAVIFSKDDLTVKGNVSLTVRSDAGHGIVSKDDLKIKSGTLTVTSAKKSLSANETLTVDGGSLSLAAGTEGMEATQIILSDGAVAISAGDDGINATRESAVLSPSVEINGGSLNITMGAGDTDGIDSNGDLIITGGRIEVSGGSGFDYDGTLTWTGGTVIVNGQEVSSIPNQMMGGFGGRGGFAGPGQNSDAGSMGDFGSGGSFGRPGGGHQARGSFDGQGGGFDGMAPGTQFG